ncbi:Hsp20/alpha crystallin family protein [Mycobacterium sp. JS623]|uniref:Hsp20/alpha crystallin family protein n=1 Tax=Mycobacterium sp. JS623 TaxID=212767 RepID=UPI00031D6B8E|nr:Hsp20/alpha crystallin family protein [Mycobacterium sp. JS623]
MINMLKFDPFFRDFDRLTQQLWGGEVGRRAMAPMDAWRDGDKVLVELDLPGVTPDSIDITADHDVLTVTAERPEPTEGDWLLAERPHGEFTRHLTLGNKVDVDGISAEFTDGVLRLTIPVAEAAKPRKIAVGPGTQQAISA